MMTKADWTADFEIHDYGSDIWESGAPAPKGTSSCVIHTLSDAQLAEPCEKRRSKCCPPFHQGALHSRLQALGGRHEVLSPRLW